LELSKGALDAVLKSRHVAVATQGAKLAVQRTLISLVSANGALNAVGLQGKNKQRGRQKNKQRVSEGKDRDNETEGK
jgi:hypothetical protein